jgi:FAD dependent oxidoreductase/S-layer homology domain
MAKFSNASLAFFSVFLLLLLVAFWHVELNEAGYKSRVASLLGQVSSATIQATSYDVVIVGAGTGGISAAIQSARMGARVALIEETDWIGGQMTAGGVPNIDEAGTIPPSGIYAEFITKVRAHYAGKGKSVSTCYFADYRNCPEPVVAQNILNQMIAETKALNISGKSAVLDVYLRTRVASVQKVGNKVTGLKTTSGLTFSSKVLVDATEYGDIIPLTGTAYRSGNTINGVSTTPGACIQDITYTATIKKYPNGLPAGFLITTPPPGYTDTVRANFARLIANNGTTIPYSTYPITFPTHNAYRGLPDSSATGTYTGLEYGKITKTILNLANDYPIPVTLLSVNPPTLSIRYLEDMAYRKNANCEAKLKTLQLVYYIQKDLGFTNWSIANDEGYATPYNTTENTCANIPASLKTLERNMAIYPYVRESRRIIGLHTLTARETKRTGTPPRAQQLFPTSIAVGDYNNDLHSCDATSTLEIGLENLSDKTDYYGPFQVPLEALIPLSTDGFLAGEKNISVTRLMNGATRLQPITMLTGQAVGALAGLAVQSGKEPRAVAPEAVQRVLIESNSAISSFLFTDVPTTYPFWKHIQMVSARGILIGYGNGLFGVDDTLTRRTSAITLARRFNTALDPAPTTPTFSDVPTTDAGYKHIEALHKNGVTMGCASLPLKFCPDRTITRAEYLVMLVRGLGWSTASAPKTPQYFADVPPTHWAFPYLQLAYQRGLTSGCSSNPTKFCPDDNATRGQISVFLANSFWPK